MAYDQQRLDVTSRSRTSLLPWRGQFSPELVEYLLATFLPHATRVADPFCGSGTVLSESLRRGINSVGADINPAAFILSTATDFLEQSPSDRTALAEAARTLVLKSRAKREVSIPDIIGAAPTAPLKHILHVAAVVGCGDKSDFDSFRLLRGLDEMSRIFRSFPTVTGRVVQLLGDCRSCLARAPLYDAILTSPPYINVFNYHQNYRPILEHLGWKPLRSAVAEIGANRKFRQNRFLTVIQYCIDMQEMIHSMHRGMVEGGRMVMVIGRESNVLRTAFRNGEIFEALVSKDNLFRLETKLERSFTNRFGKLIFEDILVFDRLQPSSPTPVPVAVDSAEIGRDFLKAARPQASSDALRWLDEAIEQAHRVQASPHPKIEYSKLWPEPTAQILRLAS